MKFSYNNGMARLYDNKYTNVIQSMNPYSQSMITNKEEAIVWAKEYAINNYSSNYMYFEMIINEENLIAGTESTLVLKESTSQLTGKYDIVIAGTKESIVKEVQFMDGEAIINIIFESADVYEILLNNQFLIGENKFLAFVDESDTGVSMYGTENSINNGFKLTVNKKMS